MPESPVFLVTLRRPRSAPSEKRSDPFWEFGSFGITGCHDHNLMNPGKSKRLEGARLGFAQGGPHGTRLVYLTPPVHVSSHVNRIEVTWAPHEMPFRYLDAPVLAHNQRPSDFPHLEATLMDGKRSTREGKFASRFRSCTTPLKPELANELVGKYSTFRVKAPSAAFATDYTDALPKLPPKIDHDLRAREETYAAELKKARGSSQSPGCVKLSRKTFCSCAR